MADAGAALSVPTAPAAPLPPADSASESITVYARLKPVKEGDTRGEVTVPKRFGKQKALQVGKAEKVIEFSLDWFFTDVEPQEQVYDIAARDRVASVLGGFNATIMAYGQTGSGKTHTMMGPDEVLYDFANSDPLLHGIVPRASDHLFEGIKHAAEDSSYIVQCSYLEVYNNNLNDLLSGKANLPMREQPNKGLVVEGLTYETITSSRQTMAALANGNSKRVVAAMKMNPRSSRGHAIFTMYVKEILAVGGEKAGKLNLVDLAGMESSKKSYAMEGASNNEMRKVEAKNINTSLYALGSVIERLSEAGRKGGGGSHIPYRDSKLTRLLQDSLGGNSKSTIIVALRIENVNIEESINTLRFAQRAKAIKTKVKDNTVSTHDTAKLLKYNDELKMQLDMAQLMVRQLQGELGAKVAEEDARLQKARDEAAAHAQDADSSAQVAALLEEVAVLRSKYSSLLHKSILHRVIKAQSEKAITALREEAEETSFRLGEADEVLQQRERENRELNARVEELERMVAAGVGGGGGAAAYGGVGAGANFDDWRAEMITDAEKELKAAMAAGDPERLKAAIAAASSTVAKARARGSHVLKKSQVLHGDGKLAERPVEHKTTAADALSEEERLYIKFHDVATDRKLALASRGFEVQGIVVDLLYDIAQREGVPEGEWGEFCRVQMPSPRLDDTSDDPAADEPSADGTSHSVVYEVVGDDGAVTKVRKAMARVTRMGHLVGWRAKLADVSCTYRQAAPDDHFGMDAPDPLPSDASGDGLADLSDPAAPDGSRSLHVDVAKHATDGPDALLANLHLTDLPGGTPQVSEREGETRAQRYNRALRERMQAREGSARR